MPLTALRSLRCFTKGSTSRSECSSVYPPSMQHRDNDRVDGHSPGKAQRFQCPEVLDGLDRDQLATELDERQKIQQRAGLLELATRHKALQDLGLNQSPIARGSRQSKASSFSACAVAAPRK